jgi:hypothetical protein
MIAKAAINTNFWFTVHLPSLWARANGLTLLVFGVDSAAAPSSKNALSEPKV